MELGEAVLKCDKEAAKAAVETVLASGADPEEVADALSRGFLEAASGFEEGRLPVPAVMGSIAAMNAGMDVLEAAAPGIWRPSGKALVCTTEGDIHPMGKNLCAAMLRASGFEVVDLGTEVPVERMVEACRRERPDAVVTSFLVPDPYPTRSAWRRSCAERG